MRPKIHTIILCCVAMLIPAVVSAQVIISEIMYDAPGLEGSGEHDWVEVFNAGASAVDVSSYRFFEANTNHTLKLESGSASLPSGGYAVIASATSTFLADWPAFGGTLFDSSFNLNSTGELIGIRVDASDTTHDFTYSPAEAATNNGSSLHRASVSSAAFSAGTPSPGTGSLSASSGNSSDISSNFDSSTSTTTGSTGSPQATTNTSANTSAPVSSYVAPPEPQIFADAGDNRTVIVAADTEFVGRAYNRKKETISGHIRFLWNFGDGSTGEGQSVLHHFEYPGKYAVVLNIADNRDAASDRIIVTAEPAKLAFTHLPDGSIVIKNDAGRDLDLSSWIVRSFGRYFVVPKDSIILAGESLRIGEKTLGFRSSLETELDYPNGALALKAGTASENLEPKKLNTPDVLAPASPPPATRASAAPAPAPSVPTANQTGDMSLSETENDLSNIEDTHASSSQTAAAGATALDSGGSYFWWFGAVGLAVIGSGAVLASRRAGKREWKIIDDSEK